MEDRVRGDLRIDTETLHGHLREESVQRHALDIRIAALEVKMSRRRYGDGESRSGAQLSPAVVEAYERTNSQAQALYAMLSKEIQSIRAEVISLRPAEGTATAVKAASDSAAATASAAGGAAGGTVAGGVAGAAADPGGLVAGVTTGADSVGVARGDGGTGATGGTKTVDHSADHSAGDGVNAHNSGAV
jgi:hypothetical protein